MDSIGVKGRGVDRNECNLINWLNISTWIQIILTNQHDKRNPAVMDDATSKIGDTVKSFAVFLTEKSGWSSRSLHLGNWSYRGQASERMTRSTALTASEEAALLERAKSFAHEENLKVLLRKECTFNILFICRFSRCLKLWGSVIIWILLVRLPPVPNLKWFFPTPFRISPFLIVFTLDQSFSNWLIQRLEGCFQFSGL